MVKSVMGKEGQVQPSSISSLLKVSSAIVLAVSLVNPLLVLLKQGYFPSVSLLSLVFSLILLVLSLVGLSRKEEDATSLLSILALTVFNCAFLFPGGVYTLLGSALVALAALILAGIKRRGMYVVLMSILVVMQAIVGVMISIGRV